LYFSSIRLRLTLWLSLTLAVILTASGFFWLTYLEKTLFTHADERSRLIAEDILSFHNYYHTATQIQPSCANLRDFIQSHTWGAYVQILDDRGEISCTSANLGTNRLPLDKAALLHASRGEPHYASIEQEEGRALRVLTYPILEQGRIFEIVQIGEPLAEIEETVDHFREVMLMWSPLVILGISLAGWFLAGRTLAPIASMNRSMHQITVENLGERLPVSDSDDELNQLAGTFNNMLARLSDSVGRIKHFTADASHELRTPLAILKGETEVALRWAKGPEELRATLVSNLEEIDRMGHIIEDLLSLAKSEAGELYLKITEFSLSDLLQDLYLIGNHIAEAKTIAVQLHLNVEGEIRIRADQLQIHRMLLNLVTNAIKYTPAGGRVSLSLAVKNDLAFVAIADSGYGIAAQHLPHIFERFYRIDEARNREAGGAGLGLAIVKSIAVVHGGDVSVTSEPGVGSTFTVRLPLSGPPPRTKKA